MNTSRYTPMSEAYLKMYEGKRGLWDNIHAKRKRGEAPAKKGDKDYPETLNVEENEVDEAYTVTAADKKGNTKAYQNYKKGMKGKDGNPLYVAADHMKSESLKQARKNVGASTCWDGYKAKGTKMKGGKSVPNCVKEDYIEYLIDNRFAHNRESAEVIYTHMSDKWKQVVNEEASDKLKDERMMRGGVDGNVRYDRAPKPSAGQRKQSSMKAFDSVVADLKKQYGDKAIMAKKTKK